MIFLRFACLLAGLAILVAPPVVLFPKGSFGPDLATAAAVLAALLAASSFFFIGISGHRIKRAPALRRLCALLLLAPFVAGAATLWFAADPAALWMGAVLLSFTLTVGLVLLLPLLQEPSAERLRADEGRQRRSAVFSLG